MLYQWATTSPPNTNSSWLTYFSFFPSLCCLCLTQLSNEPDISGFPTIFPSTLSHYKKTVTDLSFFCLQYVSLKGQCHKIRTPNFILTKLTQHGSLIGMLKYFRKCCHEDIQIEISNFSPYQLIKLDFLVPYTYCTFLIVPLTTTSSSIFITNCTLLGKVTYIHLPSIIQKFFCL